MVDTTKAVAAQTTPVADIMESVITKGDLANLTPNERVHYYGAVCKSLGLNPLTKPFEFITLNGKLQLYPLRTCTDQLRKINNVSLEIVSRKITDDVLTIHVRAKMPDGRCDEDFGAVAYSSLLKGEIRANAELKAVTKAKRRATLSICGLGWLDETEVEDTPGAKPETRAIPAHDASTGEINDEIPEWDDAKRDPAFVSPEGNSPAVHNVVPADEVGASGQKNEPRPGASAELPAARLAQYQKELEIAAESGSEELRRAWVLIPPSGRTGRAMEAILRRCQQRARDIDEAAKTL